MLLPASLRDDFPVLERRIDGRRIVYMDSAATSLKPWSVIQAVTRFYTECTSNVHRSVHALSEEATEAYETARESVARFISADAREVAFTRNATEALNLVAIASRKRGPVALTPLEHHSNLLPWTQGKHFFLELDERGRINVDKAAEDIEHYKPGLVTLATINNALGIRQPVQELTSIAHERGAMVVLDVSQSAGHEPVDVTALDCDYACFSSHKMLGPSGVGILYQREGLAEPMKPHYLGGEMVDRARLDGFEPRSFPWGMESGTPNIEGVMGLGAAAEYLEQVTVEAVKQHCAEPLHELYGMPESVRASFHLYNAEEEVDSLLEALQIVQKVV